MQLIDTQKWKKRARGVRKMFTTKSLILMYHRVAEEGIDPWSLAVTPAHFDQHIAILKKHTQPMSLLELSEAQRRGKVPERAAVITFDDGYANNLYDAKPILEKHQAPATVFITTGYTEKQQEYWWDELDNIFFRPGQLPEKLQLEINNKPFEYHLGKATHYSKNQQQQDYQNRSWLAKPDTRMALYTAVWEQLQVSTENERQRVLSEIIEWANYEPVPRPSHRPMTTEELRELEASGLMAIGAHTINHPSLSVHPPEIQKQEIRESQAYLEQVLNHEVTTFAYPFGDYNEQTLSIIKELEFACAVSVKEETVWKQSHSFELPRFNILDWDARKFEKNLIKWLRNE